MLVSAVLTFAFWWTVLLKMIKKKIYCFFTREYFYGIWK